MQKTSNHVFFFEFVFCGKRKRVDTTKLPVGCVRDEPFDRGGDLRFAESFKTVKRAFVSSESFMTVYRLA